MCSHLCGIRTQRNTAEWWLPGAGLAGDGGALDVGLGGELLVMTQIQSGGPVRHVVALGRDAAPHTCKS